MEQKILNTILENTYTLNELRKRLRVLKTWLVLKFFGTETELENQMSKQFNVEEITWLQNLNTDFFGQFNKDNIYSVFSKIEQMLTQTHPLIIYLPFELNNQVNISIGQYMRNLFGSPREAGKVIIFDIKLDPTLIAGCALSWQGIYKDYSLKARIGQQKEQILKNFKKYLK